MSGSQWINHRHTFYTHLHLGAIHIPECFWEAGGKPKGNPHGDKEKDLEPIWNLSTVPLSHNKDNLKKKTLNHFVLIGYLYFSRTGVPNFTYGDLTPSGIEFQHLALIFSH